MSATTSTVCLTRREMIAARLGAYLELSKPRIAVLVLAVVAVAALVASSEPLSASLWVSLLLGTALVATSASTFNQLIERTSDQHMERTRERPLPAGRLQRSEAFSFGACTLVLGLIALAWFVNPLTAAFGALTWILYVTIYTPMKSRTSANTAVGAVAGALPVFIGWAGAGGSFEIESGPLSAGMRAIALFFIVYLWQFPHFMAIAWIYRKQYESAGLKMLTVVEPTGRRAGAQAVLGSLALVPITLLPGLQVFGATYVAGSIIAGIAYVAAAVLFCWQRNDASARILLQTSLVYLPALLMLLILSPLV
jgi:heme o synthase